MKPADSLEPSGPPPSGSREAAWRQRYKEAEAERSALAEQVRSLEQMGQQLVAYAADLNRTYLELRRHLQQMTVLHEVSLEISALLDGEAVIRATAEALQRLLPSSTVHVFLQEPGSYEIRRRLSWAPNGAAPATPTAREEELVRDAMASGTNRLERDGGVPEDEPTTLVLPLQAQGRALGGICLVRDGGPAFRDADVQIAELCAGASAAALANAARYERSQRLALTDPLTGLYNRRSLEQMLEQELDKARRLGYPVGLLFADIDGFKSVNDQFGHLQGDKVLGAVARGLRRALRKTDVLARFGGDEFVALLPGCHPDAIGDVGEKLRVAVARLGMPALSGRQITVSVGGAAALGADADATVLIDVADHALYEAKALGRNRVVVMTQPTRSASAIAGQG
jgi:diguanylate cyclase (GGDEF)-like protein